MGNSLIAALKFISYIWKLTFTTQKKLVQIFVLISIILGIESIHAIDFSFFDTGSNKAKIAKENKKHIVNYSKKRKKNNVKSSNNLKKSWSLPNELKYFYKVGEVGFKTFQREALKTKLHGKDLDFIFLQIKKNHLQKYLSKNELENYIFYRLTFAVSLYLTELKENYLLLPYDYKIRNHLELTALGLSLSIKKANELNLNINSDQFSKLHDLLLSQSTPLLYTSDNLINIKDVLWKSYFLSQLDYPMDLVSEHLRSVEALIKQFPQDLFFENYRGQLSKYSLLQSGTLKKLNITDLTMLYINSQTQIQSPEELSILQKSYYKNLSQLGNSETLKNYKVQLAKNILNSERRSLMSNFSFGGFFKFIQILIGYVFVVWPLEWILIVLSLIIFAFQFNVVIVDEEQKKLNFFKKLWIMFTRAYLGSNVPFFSKLAASLILFGIGLYFNSARSFLETLIN